MAKATSSTLYASPELLVDLLNKGTLASGSLSKLKKIPNTFEMTLKIENVTREVKLPNYRELTGTHWHDD